MTLDYEPNERSIRLTQFMLPSGRRVDQWIERDGEVLAKARALEAAGFAFEAEMLRDYRTVSFEVVDRDSGENVLAHEICENGPGVVAAIDRLITTAHDMIAQVPT